MQPKKEEERQPVSYLEELYGAASERSGAMTRLLERQQALRDDGLVTG